MEVITIVYDFRAGNDGADSILALPLGTGTVLDRLRAVVARHGSKEVWVRTQPEMVGSTRRREESFSGTTSDQVFSPAELNTRLESLEPSDLLLLIDPRYWPAQEEDFDIAFEALNGYPGAIHGVTIGSDATGSTERIQLDAGGRVQRIRRLYNRVTHVERLGGVVAFSIVPAAAMSCIECDTLSELRLSLSSNRVLSRDIPLHCDLIDLTKERGYLALNEQVLASNIYNNPPAAYSRLASDILVGRGALVHETARLIGPVVLQPGATVERGATIIGPALIAAGATVRQDAIVAQSIVPCEMTIESSASVRHCIAPVVFEKDSFRTDLAHNDQAREWDDQLNEVVSPGIHDAESLPQSRYGAFKRGIELVLSLILLILFLPLFAVVAILIKLNSPGPVFFIHEREGMGGRRFPCFKFRTMRQDAHSMQRQLYGASMVDGPHFKLRNDPRATRIGRILRRLNIDELPQVFNVILGHMSLIGPRPSPFRENQYCVPWRRARLSVRPGITGLWQICRSYGSDSDFQQWIYYDILYVRHMSLWLDCKILAATVFALTSDKSIPVSWLVPSESGWVAAPPPVAPRSAAEVSADDAFARASVFI